MSDRGWVKPSFRGDLSREERALLAQQDRQRKEAWKQVHGSKHRCYYCGRALNDLRQSRDNIARRTLDHVVPFSRSGPNCPTNYVFACEQCNGMKAQLTLEEFRAAIQVITGDRVVFCGERTGRDQHWFPPHPLIRIRARKPMITLMEWAILERFGEFLPNA